MPHSIAGWSSPVARQAHNLKVVSSNLAPATKENQGFREIESLLFYLKWDTGGIKILISSLKYGILIMILIINNIKHI